MTNGWNVGAEYELPDEPPPFEGGVAVASGSFGGGGGVGSAALATNTLDMPNNNDSINMHINAFFKPLHDFIIIIS
jgi:hypothetical protein